MEGGREERFEGGGGLKGGGERETIVGGGLVHKPKPNSTPNTGWT